MYVWSLRNEYFTEKAIKNQYYLQYLNKRLILIAHVTFFFCFFKSLIVANGGLGNRVSRNQLLQVLEKCGLVDALLMPPNKPYSFVRYKTVEESKKAYDTLNGKEIVDDLGQKIILYLNFVEKGISYRYLFKNGFCFCVSFLFIPQLEVSVIVKQN